MTVIEPGFVKRELFNDAEDSSHTQAVDCTALAAYLHLYTDKLEVGRVRRYPVQQGWYKDEALRSTPRHIEPDYTVTDVWQSRNQVVNENGSEATVIVEAIYEVLSRETPRSRYPVAMVGRMPVPYLLQLFALMPCRAYDKIFRVEGGAEGPEGLRKKTGGGAVS